MRTRTKIDTASAVLWMSAFLLAALVIIQAGRLPENRAYADMAVSDSGFTIVTAPSGRGQEFDPDEVLYVLDSHSESLLVYWVEDARTTGLQVVDGGFLPAMFVRGRGN